MMTMQDNQDDASFSAAAIPPIVVAGIIDFGNKQGLPAEHWIRGTGLSLQQIYQPQTLVSFRQTAMVIRRALRDFPDIPLGLRLGAQTGLVSFGMLGFAMMSCSNLKQAFEVGIEHHQAAGSLMNVVAHSDPHETALELIERFVQPELLPFLCEEVFSSSFTLFKQINPNFSSLRRIELSYAAPRYAAEYELFFQCPVLFNQPANKLVFSSALLNESIATYSPASLSTTLSACNQLVKPESITPDMISSIGQLLRAHLPVRLSMLQVAQMLNVTERTLRRNLTELDTSFSALRDGVLQQQAKHMLSTTDTSIGDVSSALGFSDLRDFRRAFQRWTGVSPSEFRKSLS